MDPEFWIAHLQVAQAYEQLGKIATAFDALQKAGRFSERNSKALSLRSYLLAKLGRVDEARDVLRTFESVSHKRYVPPCAMALVHAGLGEREEVFECLNQAYAARDVHLIFLPVDSKWDPYRTDPRRRLRRPPGPGQHPPNQLPQPLVVRRRGGGFGLAAEEYASLADLGALEEPLDALEHRRNAALGQRLLE